MIPRIYIDTNLGPDAEITLDADQSHYLKNVLRRKVSEAVRLFNERDGEFDATITDITKKAVTTQLGAQFRAPTALQPLTLYFAPIKRGAVDYIIQKATELGVTAIQPVITQRTISARINYDRLSAIAVEACEQCERFSPPTILPSLSLHQLITDWPSDARLAYCDEAGDDPDQVWGGNDGRAKPAIDALNAEISNANEWGVLIGPEGGFTSEERTTLREQSFVTPISLGPRILRADTACIVVLTIWQSVLGDLK